MTTKPSAAALLTKGFLPLLAAVAAIVAVEGLTGAYGLGAGIVLGVVAASRLREKSRVS